MRVLFFTREHDNKCKEVRDAIMEIRDDEFHHFLPKNREFIEIDIEKKRNMADTFGIKNAPTLLLQREKSIIATFKGLPTKKNMLKFLKQINTYKKKDLK